MSASSSKEFSKLSKSRVGNYLEGVSDTLITGLVLIALLVGLVGTVVPVLPGILLMWGAVLAYGFLLSFGAFGIAITIAVTVVSGIAVALGFVIPKRLADESGASTRSQLAAVFGGIIGFFVIPVVGVIVGALAGIAIAEYLDKDDLALARTSTIAVAKGFGLGALSQIAAGFVILFLWAIWAASVVL